MPTVTGVTTTTGVVNLNVAEPPSAFVTIKLTPAATEVKVQVTESEVTDV
jgi:hypothetical protein